MVPTKGYAANGAHEPLKPFSFDRRDPQPRDVQIEILFCGVCHSDLHIVRNEWGRTIYPCVPGHEIVGRVVKVGREVRKFKEGDLAAVGCMVDSDRVCPNCRAGLEQFCDQGVTLTYNSEDKHTRAGLPTAVILKVLWSIRILCCAFRINWTRQLQPRSSVPALRLIPRCGNEK